MTDPSGEGVEATVRLLALEAVMIDFLTTVHMNNANPVEAARKYREHMRNVMASTRIPNSENASESALRHGEISDAVDELLEKVEGTIRLRQAKR
jgi:hypothetical protein